MEYQQYDWPFNPTTAPKPIPNNSGDPWATKFGTCIGDNCCSNNMTYDASTNQCVISVSGNNGISSGINNSNTTNNSGTSATESFLTESMVDKILTKQQQNKHKYDYNLKQPESFNNYR
jgi:hypothetical protein